MFRYAKGAHGRGSRAAGVVIGLAAAALLMGASGPPARPTLKNGNGGGPGGPQPPANVQTRQMAGSMHAECSTHGSGFDEDSSDGTFVGDSGATDGKACRFVARGGSDGGGVGGRIFMPTSYGKGDEIYYSVRVKLDSDWQSSDRALKWMRYRVGRSGSHVGFVNFLLNRPALNGQTPYTFSSELTNSSNTYFGRPDQDDPRFGRYDVYTVSCVLDDVAADRGGRGQCSFWMNGRELRRMTHVPTLGSASDRVNWVEFIGTFQPGSVPKTQNLWVDWVKVGGGPAR